MINIKVGIIDYDLGNQDSLFYVLKSLGFRVCKEEEFRFRGGHTFATLSPRSFL